MCLKHNLIVFYVLILLLLQGYGSVAQTGVITGIVMDALTAEPLPFAHVFVNQTTIGTATNERGHYTLNNVPVGESALVVSFVGYKSLLQKIQVKEGVTLQLDVKLYDDNKQLENIEVKGTRDREWQRQLKKFEKYFFGYSTFAKSIRILNPWVLDFSEPGNNTFMATSSRPLEIINEALGYRVFYYLKSLMTNSEGYNIIGEVRFEEINADDPKVIKMHEQNRKQVYNGSLRHLMKSIINDKVQEEGFNLYTEMIGYESSPYRSSIFSEQLNKSIQSFPTKNIIIPGKAEGEFIIPLKQRLEIHYVFERSNTKVYSDITCPVSWLEVKDGFLRVNSNGIILNPPFAVVSGAMYDDRVAHLLPYNYLPN